MNFISDNLLLALGWILTQNIVLNKGIGMEFVISASRRKIDLPLVAGLISVLSLLSALLCYPLSLLLNAGEMSIVITPVCYIIILMGIYTVSHIGLSRFAPEFREYLGSRLPFAVFNSVVFAVPLMNNEISRDLLSSAFFAVCTGVGFLLAASLISLSTEWESKADVPDAFKGMPARLVYIAMIVLAFMGISGGIT